MWESWVLWVFFFFFSLTPSHLTFTLFLFVSASQNLCSFLLFILSPQLAQCSLANLPRAGATIPLAPLLHPRLSMPLGGFGRHDDALIDSPPLASAREYALPNLRPAILLSARSLDFASLHLDYFYRICECQPSPSVNFGLWWLFDPGLRILTSRISVPSS